ncbi:hypothetical protein Q0Z83_047660 [Actinoplanes sichuanensis]|uniref:PH domain-containing protein n=1 Tax=Actinoplanes sichuanensis TaxID=512349 RepID=A0ABW4APG3_9ACTN|nr:hypothetical protein [Actinoplanes sichuanensis]BEL06575.1 hypothetical protein Q0Z83_047660 [Actinoplanes sichuanensis]
MPETVPPRVHNAAETADLGPLVQRFRHPNARVFAIITWAYFAMVAGLLLVMLASIGMYLAGSGREPEWLVVLIYTVVGGGLAYLLAQLAIGNVTRRAIYLYPGGYVATGPSGRVIRTIPWHRLDRIDGMGVPLQMQVKVVGAKARTVFAFRHNGGWPRPIKFTEVAGQEQLAPLAYRLYIEAISKPAT